MTTIPSLDDQFMELALVMARRGLGQCHPNPSVGAVITDGGKEPLVISRGWTQAGGKPHGEIFALDQAGSRAKGGTLYVTLEPCAHHGKTPPCTRAIIKAGIERVIYGIRDPDPRVSGSGISELEAAGIQTLQTSSRLQKEAEWTTMGHILRTKKRRPFIQLKLAVGSDNKIPAGTGTSRWITSKNARAAGHLMRARTDAILIGIGTALADNPALTCRLPGLLHRSPARVLLDSKLKIPLNSNLVKSSEQVPLCIFCSENARADRKKELAEQGVQITTVDTVDLNNRLNLKTILGRLAEKGITRLMVEGGPNIAKSFLMENFIDEAVIFSGECAVGLRGLKPFADCGLDVVTESPDFQLVEERQLLNDTMKIYRHG